MALGFHFALGSSLTPSSSGFLRDAKKMEGWMGRLRRFVGLLLLLLVGGFLP